MSITAKELAKKLNLSQAAISMALNNKPGVSTATHIKVIEAAKEYGYDFIKIDEVTEQNTIHGTILFIIYKKCGAIVKDTPFFSQLSEGINDGCKNARYNLNINYIYDNDNINDAIDDLNRFNFSGIILLGTEMMPTDIKQFLKLKSPLVILDTYFNSIDSNFVLINNEQGAFTATNHLIRCCQSQPGYLRSSYSIANFEERANGFYHAIRSNGMSTSKSIVHHLSPSFEGAYADMCSILKTDEKLAKCYFADNAFIACGAMKALKEYGYNIPKDISIVGLDDIPMCNYMEPALTTIQVQKEYMGKTAVNRLIQLINDPTSPSMKIELTTKIVIRKSVV